MNRLRKTALALFILPFAFLLVFSANLANAEVRTKDVELQTGFGCSVTLPGGVTTDPTEFPIIINATVPEWVGPNEQFYLTDVSVEMVIFEGLPPSYFPVGSIAESPVFRISSENTDTSIMSGPFDNQEVPRPGEGSIFLPNEGGSVDVGPFTAGEEGEVIIKAQQIGMNVNFGLPVALTCVPMGGKNDVIASIPIDSEAPVITLNGYDPIIVKQGDPYVEPGATSEDNYDGDLTDKIEISGDVDTSAIGTYTVTYTVSDSVGNVATVERTVNVVEPFGYWYTGEGPPSDELGRNGDSYLDLLTGDVYKRDPNKWTKVGNIKGDDGKQGSSIHTGSGTPKANLGDIGDLYLDTRTGDVYEKNADGWVKIANLQGPAGPAGPQGQKGSDGTGGGSSDGDGKGTKGSGTDKGDKDSKGASKQGGKLPKTATSLPTLILIGALIAIVGGVMVIRRRQAME